jgi:hypothetical protein
MALNLLSTQQAIISIVAGLPVRSPLPFAILDWFPIEPHEEVSNLTMKDAILQYWSAGLWLASPASQLSFGKEAHPQDCLDLKEVGMAF